MHFVFYNCSENHGGTTGRKTDNIYFSLGTNASADSVVRGATTQYKFIIGCPINNFEPLKTSFFFFIHLFLLANSYEPLVFSVSVLNHVICKNLGNFQRKRGSRFT